MPLRAEKKLHPPLKNLFPREKHVGDSQLAHNRTTIGTAASYANTGTAMNGFQR
jgi:hypothetical protein